MSTLLEESPLQTATVAAQRLRSAMAATRVSIRWLGVRRALSNEQRAEAAEPFGAEADYLSAAKKLLDTNYPAFKGVTSVRNKVVSFWRPLSLPFPESGVRLVRQDKVDQSADQMRQFQDELTQTELNRAVARATAGAVSGPT